MKGKSIIGISFFVWVIALVIILVSNNPYLNVVVFGLGAMLTVLGLSYGFEKLENTKK